MKECKKEKRKKEKKMKGKIREERGEKERKAKGRKECENKNNCRNKDTISSNTLDQWLQTGSGKGPAQRIPATGPRGALSTPKKANLCSNCTLYLQPLHLLGKFSHISQTKSL